jgi:hypothetical protein
MSMPVIRAAAGLVLLLPAAAGAQQRWERQVQDRLARAVAALPEPAARPVLTRAATLNVDERAVLEVTLEEGRTYAIVAVCDDDCTRLQLALVTSSGSDLAKERSSESLPILRVVAPRAGRYTIGVVMEGCRWNPCWYAVAVVPLGNPRASQ